MDVNELHPLKAEFIFTMNEKLKCVRSIDIILLALVSISELKKFCNVIKGIQNSIVTFFGSQVPHSNFQ